jgi:hypothetical protein
MLLPDLEENDIRDAVAERRNRDAALLGRAVSV